LADKQSNEPEQRPPSIAAAIDARASKRARRAMTTHIESGIWAISQLQELNQSNNATSALPATAERRG
jgi:DNA-binding FadR family transcriptional regulator